MKLGNAKTSKNRLLTHRFQPGDLKRFFKWDRLYIGYSRNITDNQSLLNVPLVGSVISLCWLHDTDLRVPTLDETYMKNITQLRDFYSKLYDLDFNSELIVDEPMKNKATGDRKLLFFSGGLDSTYSLYRNLSPNLELLMICGYDMYMENGHQLRVRAKWVQIYRKYAEKLGLRLNLAYTNIRSLLKEDLTIQESSKRLPGSFWDMLRHAPCLFGAATPLGADVNEIILSSNGCREWDTSTQDNMYGSGFNVAPMLTWGDSVAQYCCDADRFEKAQYLRDVLNSGDATLRVCFKPLVELNCMECEKCLRTLSQLVLVGVDPSRCGMKPPRGAWKRFRDMFVNGEIKRRRILIHFIPMQQYILEHNPTLPPESHIFYDYIRDADFSEYLNQPQTL